MKTNISALLVSRACRGMRGSIFSTNQSLSLFLDHCKRIFSLLIYKTLLSLASVLTNILGFRGVVKPTTALQYQIASHIICSTCCTKHYQNKTANSQNAAAVRCRTSWKVLDLFLRFKLSSHKADLLNNGTIQRALTCLLKGLLSIWWLIC